MARLRPLLLAFSLPRPLAQALALFLPLLLLPAAARAQSFEVFCVSNNDGTVSCQGWRGGETLTCVASRGGVNSCTTPSGRRFTCVLDAAGVSSCADPPGNRQERDDTNCTFTGDGNFVCNPPRPRSQPLLPGPQLPGSQLPGPQLPSPGTALPPLPSSAPVITNPSVFDP